MASEFLKARQTRYGAFVAFYLVVIIAIVIVANWLADHHNKTLDGSFVELLPAAEIRF